jgi:antitoxin MazE
MKVNIISIGNSKGIRIPRAILEQCNLNDEALIEVKNKVLLIKSAEKKPRKGWDKAFKSMHNRKEDSLFIDDTVDIELKDWVW